MPQYLVAGYLPDDFDPSAQDESIMEEIHALNREMIAAGVRRFAGGLGPTRTVRPQPNGEVLITDGPYLETKEHIGGLWILECADMDEALAWVRKGAKACRWPVELREIFFVPAPAEARRQEADGRRQTAGGSSPTVREGADSSNGKLKIRN